MIQNYRDRNPWTETVDSDQTAPEEQSDQGLHCLPFLCKFLTDLGIVKVICYFHWIIFRSKYLGQMRYIKGNNVDKLP